jgi:subtilisin family serine protease
MRITILLIEDWIVAISLSQEDGQAALYSADQEATVQSSESVPGSSYEAWDGISMATPHVSGVAALLWSANPKWTNIQIRQAM